MQQLAAHSFVGTVAAQARRRPDRQAFVTLDNQGRIAGELSYGELDTRARAIGGMLSAAGARGERVLLPSSTTVDFVAALLGCLYAGAVVVPLPPLGGRRRLERLIEIGRSAAARFGLAPRDALAAVAERTSEAPVEWLALEECVTGAAAGWEPASPAGDDLALLQYTSGSTSAPRGVMITHANLHHNQELLRRAFQQDEHSTIVAWTPLFHDMGLIGNVLHAVYVGCRCVMLTPSHVAADPRLWLRAISTFRGTASGGPDLAYEMCVSRTTPADRAGLDLSSWRVAYDGSEPVRAATIERFTTAFAEYGFAPSAFCACYGLAEATLYVAGGIEATPPRVRELKPGPDQPSVAYVGLRLLEDDPEVAIVDPVTHQRCAGSGEIWVRSASVGRGYWGPSDESEPIFAARPAGELEAATYLRTGDLGCLLDRYLYVIGRLKNVLIVGGRNVPAEDVEGAVHEAMQGITAGACAVVETAAQRMPVVVQECRDARDGERLAGVVRTAVVDACQFEPAEIVFVSKGAIPRTSSGKMRRAELRRLLEGGALDVLWRWTSQVLTPRGERLAPDIGAQLQRYLNGRLGGGLEGLSDNVRLSALGLDSFGAAAMSFDLRDAFGIDVAPHRLMQATPRRLIRMAERRRRPSSAPEDPLPPTADLELTAGQQAMYFLYQLDAHRAGTHIVRAARLRTTVDPVRLGEAAAQVVARHPGLQLTFRASGGCLVQRLGEVARDWYRVIDARDLTQAALARALHREGYRPFALDRAPLLRLVVFANAAGGDVLLLACHHIIADLWSLSVIVTELVKLYADPAVSLPEAGDFRLFLQEQRRYEHGARAAVARRFWQRRRAPGRGSGHRAWAATPVLSRPQVQRFARTDVVAMQRLAASEATTTFVVWLAVVTVLQGRLLGATEIVLCTMFSARESRWRHTVGLFANPIPVITNIEGASSFREVVRRVAVSVRRAARFERVPYESLLRAAAPSPQGQGATLAPVLFSYQSVHAAGAEFAELAVGAGDGPIAVGGFALEPIALGAEAAHWDVVITAGDLSSGDTILKIQSNEKHDGRLGKSLQQWLLPVAAELATRPDQSCLEPLQCGIQLEECR